MKGKPITIIITEDEYSQLDSLAKKSFQTIDQYIKAKIFGNADDLGKLLVQTLTKINRLASGTEFNVPQLFGLDWNKFIKGTRVSLGKKVLVESKQQGSNFKAIYKDRSNLQWYRKL